MGSLKDHRSHVPLLQEIAARTSCTQLLRRHGTGGIQHSPVSELSGLCTVLVDLTCFRYFIERGTWDPSIEVFLDSHGEPSQFTVRPPLVTLG